MRPDAGGDRVPPGALDVVAESYHWPDHAMHVRLHAMRRAFNDATAVLGIHCAVTRASRRCSRHSPILARCPPCLPPMAEFLARFRYGFRTLVRRKSRE